MEDLPSLPLGALPKGVTPLELAHAYATLAMHGSRRGDSLGKPITVTAVRSRDGVTETPRTRKRAIDRGAADLTTKTLQGVITRGTGTSANPGRAAAGKTGTTELNADAWFAGYTPELVVVVWVGRPEGAIPMRTEFNGGPVFGGTWPALIWKKTVEGALEKVPPRNFNLEVPKTISVRVDPNSGKLAGAGCAAKVVRVLEGFEPKVRESACDSNQAEDTAEDVESSAPTSNGQDVSTTVVPDVVGMSVDDARAELEQLGLTVNFRGIRGTSAELGLVATQSQLPGTVIASSSQNIELDVVTTSPGGGSFTLPQ
jgi:membrane peptidoglycan carboxypeptidase